MRRFLMGFTMIEVVIVIAILAILASTLIPVVSKGIDAYIMSSKNREEIAAARLALSRMIREIREECTSINDATSITFGFNGRAIIYKRDPDRILRRYVNNYASSQVLSRDVESVAFTYYKQDGSTWISGTDPLLAIRLIEIRLEIKRASDNTAVILQSRVTPRNL